MCKLRLWWIPQLGNCDSFYVPISTPEEGKKILDIWAADDAFQLQNKVKPDYCNAGGLQMFDESEKEWVDWRLDTEDDYFDDVKQYCESDCCNQKEELETFGRELFKQIDWKSLP